MKTLHILNGDATLFVFNQTTIAGDILVWREILSDGPVSKKNLWELRSDWIFKKFGETPANYQQKVIKEAEKLTHLDQPLNLMYVLNFLESHFRHRNIYEMLRRFPEDEMLVRRLEDEEF